MNEQMNEQMEEQKDEQTDEQKYNPTDEQMNEQMNEQMDDPTDEQHMNDGLKVEQFGLQRGTHVNLQDPDPRSHSPANNRTIQVVYS